MIAEYGQLKAAIVVAGVLLGAMNVALAAQPTVDRSTASPFSPDAPMQRTGMIKRFGLDHSSLRLTKTQAIAVERLVDSYLKEVAALTQEYPFTLGARPSPEATTARTKARISFTASIGALLSADQKKSWDAALVAGRRPDMRGNPRVGVAGPP